jgi:hypothetical protein
MLRMISEFLQLAMAVQQLRYSGLTETACDLRGYQQPLTP